MVSGHAVKFYYFINTQIRRSMKKIYAFLLMIVCALTLFSQNMSAQKIVQGVPRTDLAGSTKSGSNAVKKADGYSVDIKMDSIKYWVGKGTNRAALVVKWNDKDGNYHKLVWGYRWTSKSEPTGESMLRAIAKEDPRFYMLVYGETQYGAAIGGMGFDANEDGDVALVNGGKEYELTDGVYNTSVYDFDDWSAKDANDYWGSGWYSGYWSYYTTDDSSVDFSYSGVGASSRELEDGSIDGWSFCCDMTNWFSADMSGTVTYVSAPEEKSDYSNGAFIVNEDWYGHQNSTVNFLTNDGEWVYRVVQKENDGVQLGCTAQYGQIYGGNFYIMSKQEQDPGASIKGGRINVFDAKTMKVKKQIATISTNDNGKSNADGRGFLGVDEHKGYVGTSNGIFILDLDSLGLKGKVEGSSNGETSSYGQLYSGQVGMMVRVNDRVFAVHQKKGLLVINPETDQVDSVIAAPEGWGFGSVVMSKDGNLWLSLADKSGTGTADNRIVKLDPNTLEEQIIDLPDGIYGPSNSWYAWTPDCFCASNQQNVLYWNGGTSSWFSGYTIYKYDIDKNEFSTYLDFTNDADGYYIYGCSFRIDPVTDNALVSLFKGYADQTYVLRKYDANGEKVGEYPMITNYWFPSLPVFPDNEAPVIANPLSDLTLEAGTSATIDLSNLATDADNFQAAIVKTVKAVSDEDVVEAKMHNGSLVVNAKKEGSADVTIKVNSNGKVIETTLAVNVTKATGIENLSNNADARETARFSADGKRISAAHKGINIIRMSDGSVRKVVVK